MKLLAIIGPPGCGKTTVMKRILAKVGGEDITARSGLLDYHVGNRVIVLGKYEPSAVFGGSDRLSMAVQPDAESFLLRMAEDKGFDAILWEGDRLGNASFFRHARQCGDFRLLALEASPEVLKARRDGRSGVVGKAQDATWLKGRESKVWRLKQDFFGEERRIDTDEQVHELLEEIVEWIRTPSHLQPLNVEGRLF